MTAEVRHLPVVERRTVNRSVSYVLTCTCGQTWPEYAAKRMASADRMEHLMAVSTVPAAERCRDNRAHRRQPWEFCALCAGQLDLFDLTELEAS